MGIDFQLGLYLAVVGEEAMYMGLYGIAPTERGNPGTAFNSKEAGKDADNTWSRPAGQGDFPAYIPAGRAAYQRGHVGHIACANRWLPRV